MLDYGLKRRKSSGKFTAIQLKIARISLKANKVAEFLMQPLIASFVNYLSFA